MCNMLTVTQMLNQKVKVEKVDPYYPFHPGGRTPKPGDETRLLFTPAEADAWVEKGLLALVPPNWKQVKKTDSSSIALPNKVLQMDANETARIMVVVLPS